MASKRPSFFKNQNFYKLKDEFLRNQELFYDEYFPLNVPDAEWIRPYEICEDPRFFVEGASRCDVIQGQMGDCWLIVAMANLTLNQTLFKHVVPIDQSFRENYTGMFRFRIWQCGQWVEVVVDDRLPTKNGQLIFVHSKQKNEFWSALLEKAYAKLYGSYDQLSGGWFCESMVDFTGGIVETVSLVPTPLDLEKILISAINKSSFMCVFMKNDPSIKEKQTADGLVKGHAYSVTNVRNVTLKGFFGVFSQENIFLIKLRNPWGKVEWNGAWSDSSEEWKSIGDEEKRKMGLSCENDGEFWMSLSDFANNFQYIDICHLSPCLFNNVSGVQENPWKEFVEHGKWIKDVNHSKKVPENRVGLQGTQLNLNQNDENAFWIHAKKNWEEHVFRGEWIKDVNAGGISSETIYMDPKFKITLVDTDDDEDNLCTLIIALMQKNKTRKVWHRIGFTVLKVDDPEALSGALSKEDIINKRYSTTIFKHTREIVMRYKWPPGVYCIMPSTYSPNDEGQFLLRVYTEEPCLMEEIVEIYPGLTITKAGREGKHLQKLVNRSDEEVKAFFNRIAGKEKEVGWQGLQSVLEFALTPNFRIFSSIFDSRNAMFPKVECRTLITMLDDNCSGKLDYQEFQTLWGKMRQWESIYLQCSRNSEYITAPVLKQALIMAGYRVSSCILGSMVARHADDEGRFTFNDFVMCAVELQTSR